MTEVDSRAYTALIREAVLGVLADFAPRALCTSEVQRAFRREDCQRVYNALRKLEERGEIVHFHEIERSWWAIERFGCSSCDRPAQRILVRSVYMQGERQPQAFYTCAERGRQPCFDAPLGGFTWRPILSPFYGPDPLALAEGFVA